MVPNRVKYFIAIPITIIIFSLVSYIQSFTDIPDAIVWDIQTVDSGGDIGYYSAIALDNNDFPHISYSEYNYASVSIALKYAHWTGSSWAIQTVDSTGNVGWFPSIALDSNDYPHISYGYGDITNGDLKYAKWTGSGWDIQTVESTGNVGWFTSLALDSSGYPHISFRNNTNGDLKYAKWTGTSWNIQTVESTGDVGWYTSLALDSNNYPHICHRNNINGDIRYARWTGTSWSVQTVDSPGNMATTTSLALDSNNYAHISYGDYTSGALKYAKWTGSSWNTQTVDSAGYVGVSNSLALDYNDQPHISYGDHTYGKLMYTRWTGSSWDKQTVESVFVPYGSSIALDRNYSPHFSYIKDLGASGNLKYAKAVMNPSITVTSPNGGENWQPGSTHSINWTQTELIGIVTIDLIKGGDFNSNLGTAAVTAGTFPWTIPSDQASGSDYKVKIYQGTVSDISNNTFTIPPALSIEVTSPIGGESWEVNKTYDITWTLIGLTGTVFIDLYKNGSFDSSIGSASATGQTFSWQIPLTQTPGSDYRVRLYQGSIGDYSDNDFSIFAAVIMKKDLLGTWGNQGVYYRNSDTGGWVKMAAPATQIAAGDIDNDGIDDLIGIWPSQGGLWVEYSSDGSWTRISSAADWISSGDMNGDGRDDLLGTWTGQGVYYQDSVTKNWVMMAAPASQVTAGDIDNDGIDDLIGIWPSQGGLWVKHSSNGSWIRISSAADWISSGDMNGDGRDDLLGTWTGQGVYYQDSVTGNWIKMAAAASQIAAGDIDGDGTDDLLGIWLSQGGLWVKYSSNGSWALIASATDWIVCGQMRNGGAGSSNLKALSGPFGGYANGPGGGAQFNDLSDKGPGGESFIYYEAENLFLRENNTRVSRSIGPGEPGFICTEQKNLIPQEKLLEKIRKKYR